MNCLRVLARLVLPTPLFPEDKGHTSLYFDWMTASMTLSISSLSVKLSKGILEIAFSLCEKRWIHSWGSWSLCLVSLLRAWMHPSIVVCWKMLPTDCELKGSQDLSLTGANLRLQGRVPMLEHLWLEPLRFEHLCWFLRPDSWYLKISHPLLYHLL